MRSDATIEAVVQRSNHYACKTHCCKKHGCKYGYKDCPVKLGEVKQAYPCEECDEEKEEKAMASVMVEKSVVTTVTMVLDGEKAKSLEDWLMWSFQVWKKIQEFPMLEDEIFNPDKVKTPRNIDPIINIRNALRDA